MDQLRIYCVRADVVRHRISGLVAQPLSSPLDVLGFEEPTVVMPAEMVNDELLVKLAATVAAEGGNDPDFVAPYAVQVLGESTFPGADYTAVSYIVRRGHSRALCELNGTSYDAELQHRQYADPVTRHQSPLNLYEKWICVCHAPAPEVSECDNEDGPEPQDRVTTGSATLLEVIQADAQKAFTSGARVRFETLRALLFHVLETVFDSTGSIRASDALTRSALKERLDFETGLEAVRGKAILTHTLAHECRYYLGLEPGGSAAIERCPTVALYAVQVRKPKTFPAARVPLPFDELRGEHTVIIDSWALDPEYLCEIARCTVTDDPEFSHTCRIQAVFLDGARNLVHPSTPMLWAVDVMSDGSAHCRPNERARNWQRPSIPERL